MTQTDSIIKQGYLRKENIRNNGFSIEHSFQKRWVVIETHIIQCYKTCKQQDITHTIDLNEIQSVSNSTSSDSKHYQFQLVYKAHRKLSNIVFNAANNSDRNAWIRSIQSIIANTNITSISSNNTSNKPSTSSSNNITGNAAANKHLSVFEENRSLYLTVQTLKQIINRYRKELRRYIPNKTQCDAVIQKIEHRVRSRKAKKSQRPNSLPLRGGSSNGTEGDDEADDDVDVKIDSRPNVSPSVYKRKSPLIGLSLTPPLLAQSRTSSFSDNEFETDEMSLSGNAVEGKLVLTRKLTDVFNQLQTVQESKLIKKLMNETIIYDSKMKIFSSSNNSYIDTACILTKNNIYWVSAINYQIWLEFAQRTKIEELINDNNYKIDKEKAKKLTENLDIIDDEKVNKEIRDTFIGKTKKQIKLSIVLKETPIKSVSCLFPTLSAVYEHEITRFQHLKEVNSIIIKDFYNVNIISEKERDTFLDFILHEIPWIDQQKVKMSLIITLQSYYAHSVIGLIDARKKEYLHRTRKTDERRMQIYEHDHKVKYTHYGITMAELKCFSAFNYGHIDRERDGFAFILKHKHVKNDEDDGDDAASVASSDSQSHEGDIKCLVPSNNVCQEWLTHLDYLLTDKSKLNDRDAVAEKQRKSSLKDKLVNDFTNNDAYFGFGVYLNYWQDGFENTVHPKYATLKEELCTNTIWNISEKQYYDLYEKCFRLLQERRHQIKASEIGVNNKKFNIAKGEPITINHLIALKLYTDFTLTQKELKKTCRKKNPNESMKQLIERNSECAHWCRLIKESCTFYGKLMKSNITLYTGLKTELLFGSMRQHFECPISTTLNRNKAQSFCEDSGIILKLKAGNSKTRYFDVSWLSMHQEEQERLVMGSSLTITDIYTNAKGSYSNHYVNALRLLEQLMNGHFVTANLARPAIQEKAYNLLACVMKIEGYQSIEQPPSKYLLGLTQNMMEEIQRKYKEKQLWMNRNELDKIQHQQLRQIYERDGQFFNHFQMKAEHIHWVQEYEWNIGGKSFQKFKAMPARKYMESAPYLYAYQSDTIKFHLKSCAKYSDESNKCAVFVYIDNLNKNIESIQIEYDILCEKHSDKKSNSYQNRMMPQCLDAGKLCCGEQTFPTHSLAKLSSMTWKVALRIIDVNYMYPFHHQQKNI